MKKMNKKAFTLIELIVVVAVVGILVLLAMPRFIGHKDKAELARIQHDVKVMEQEIGTLLINNDDDFNEWESNSKDFNQLIQEGRLFEKEGIANKVESIDKTYKITPEKYKDKINTKLKGTFYANNDGKVYYEHEKPLLGIPIKPEEKEPEYSDEEIDDLVKIDYIPIATAEDLNSIRSTEKRIYAAGTEWETENEVEGGLDKKYVQVANIDLSGYSEEGWNPIGNNSASFTGTYDGGNYIITGLEVKGAGKDNQGLFGYASGATIRNVGLIDNKVTGGYNAGGLVGAAYYSTNISNSYATGSVTGTNWIGGLVGEVDGSTINNSYATGEVTGKYDIGGLVGNAYRAIIENSYATGEVTGSDEEVGGLVGYSYGSTIENSYATGSVKGTNGYIGGLVGNARYDTIKNSYATGSVEGTEKIGGLIGDADNSKIENSYATGSVEGTENVGGLIGEDNSNTISNSSATGSVEGTENVGGLVGVAHRSNISNSYTTGPVTGTIHVGGIMGEDYYSTIENSYATGLVAGEDRVGGLVGYANTTISNSYATGPVTGKSGVGGLMGEVFSGSKISNSYATGPVEGTENVGGLVGWDFDKITIENSYWDTETTGQEESTGGGVGKSADDMKLKETYEGWDFDNVWNIVNGEYPTLK